MPWILLHKLGRSIYIYIYIEQCTYTYGRLTPLAIKHRCLAYHYTKLGTSIYIEQCTYTYGRLTSLVMKHRCLEYHYTKLGRSIYIEQCIYTHGILTPHQLSIDALKTATPNLAHVMAEQCTYTHGRWIPLQMSIDALNTTIPNLADQYIYRRMHIYPWQTDPLAN